MFKIRCFLPNASEEINGVAFVPCADGGVESVEAIPEEQAMQFEGIKGYALIPAEVTKPARKAKSKEE